MSWSALCLFAAGTFALKATGPLLLGGRALPAWIDRLALLLPAALLAGLVCVQTLGDGHSVTLDPRAAGLAGAAAAAWRKAPFAVIVVVAMGMAALTRQV